MLVPNWYFLQNGIQGRLRVREIYCAQSPSPLPILTLHPLFPSPPHLIIRSDIDDADLGCVCVFVGPFTSFNFINFISTSALFSTSAAAAEGSPLHLLLHPSLNHLYQAPALRDRTTTSSSCSCALIRVRSSSFSLRSQSTCRSFSCSCRSFS